ncbi:unnamed protein product [Chrysoparadoxa australica]
MPLLLPTTHSLIQATLPDASICQVLATAAGKLGVQVVEASMRGCSKSSAISTATALRALFQSAAKLSPCVLHITGLVSLELEASRGTTGSDETDLRFAAALQVCADEVASAGALVVLVGSSGTDLPTGLKRIFTHVVDCPLPSEDLRFALLTHHLRGVKLSQEVTHAHLRALAKRLAGRDQSDIIALVSLAGVVAVEGALGSDQFWLNLAEDAAEVKAEAQPKTEAHVRRDIEARVCRTESASPGLIPGELCVKLSNLLEAERRLLPPPASLRIGCPSIPTVKWEDIGGLETVRQELMDVIELPLEHPELFTSGLKRRTGILLYGPPGTGKTLLAKAVATECDLPFFSIKGPELLDMYVGESEKNVRQVFKQARDTAPCVLFFDELDSLAPQRGRGADSGGVMDRVVAQLLAELDGAAHCDTGDPIFVIGATNRPDLLDSSLLRPGRFDRLLYLGTGGDATTQLQVLRAITRKIAFEQGVNLKSLVDKFIPASFTGADMSAVASAALQMALRKKVDKIISEVDRQNEGEFYGAEISVQHYLARVEETELEVLVSQNELTAAAQRVVPSVSEEELLHYEKLRAEYSSG